MILDFSNFKTVCPCRTKSDLVKDSVIYYNGVNGRRETLETITHKVLVNEEELLMTEIVSSSNPDDGIKSNSLYDALEDSSSQDVVFEPVMLPNGEPCNLVLCYTNNMNDPSSDVHYTSESLMTSESRENDVNSREIYFLSSRAQTKPRRLIEDTLRYTTSDSVINFDYLNDGEIMLALSKSSKDLIFSLYDSSEKSGYSKIVPVGMRNRILVLAGKNIKNSNVAMKGIDKVKYYSYHGD